MQCSFDFHLCNLIFLQIFKLFCFVLQELFNCNIFKWSEVLAIDFRMASAVDLSKHVDNEEEDRKTTEKKQTEDSSVKNGTPKGRFMLNLGY